MFSVERKVKQANLVITLSSLPSHHRSCFLSNRVESSLGNMDLSGFQEGMSEQHHVFWMTAQVENSEIRIDINLQQFLIRGSEDSLESVPQPISNGWIGKGGEETSSGVLASTFSSSWRTRACRATFSFVNLSKFVTKEATHCFMTIHSESEISAGVSMAEDGRRSGERERKKEKKRKKKKEIMKIFPLVSSSFFSVTTQGSCLNGLQWCQYGFFETFSQEGEEISKPVQHCWCTTRAPRRVHACIFSFCVNKLLNGQRVPLSGHCWDAPHPRVHSGSGGRIPPFLGREREILMHACNCTRAHGQCFPVQVFYRMHFEKFSRSVMSSGSTWKADTRGFL